MTSHAAATPGENPLVPHAVLRAMYASLLEARLLEQRLGARRHRRREPALLSSLRAAAVACMKPGDLVSDASPSAAADLMLGAPLRAVWRRAGEQAGGDTSALGKQRLPPVPDVLQQLRTATGAAQALKLQGNGAMTWVLCPARREPAIWREVLGYAAQYELPIVFLAVPSGSPGGRAGVTPGELSDRARGWGVPGIPVDAADGVALYRVLSEASLRARSGDGPTLVEGVLWRPVGTRTPPVDPLLALSLALLARGAATTRWQAGVRRRFEAKLAALEGPRADRPRPTRGLH